MNPITTAVFPVRQCLNMYTIGLDADVLILSSLFSVTRPKRWYQAPYIF